VYGDLCAGGFYTDLAQVYPKLECRFSGLGKGFCPYNGADPNIDFIEIFPSDHEKFKILENYVRKAKNRRVAKILS
jgi:hypothetical protein